MKNTTLINLSQNFPAWLRSVGMKFSKNRQQGKSQKIQKSIAHFESDKPKDRRALVSFNPASWQAAELQAPNIKLYNHNGFLYDLVYALNQAGYLVDLADPYTEQKLDEDYDLFIGHGGYCVWMLEQLDPNVTVIQYISGLYWKQFLSESNDRYDHFYLNIKAEQPELHRRSIVDLADGLEVLNNRADILFSLNCPRMVKAYGKNAHKFFYTGLGAFIDEKLEIDQADRDFSSGMKNFIYVGGSGGNLQKGLDLFVTAFSEMPDYNLYIYCKVEEEILTHMKDKLNAKNIHYIYHWRFDKLKHKLQELLKTINFSLHAPINTGIGTAFSGTLAVGMIPVGYIDLHDHEAFSILSEDWDVKSLQRVIKDASNKSPEWCKKAAVLSKEYFENNCAPETVKNNLVRMIDSVDQE